MEFIDTFEKHQFEPDKTVLQYQKEKKLITCNYLDIIYLLVSFKM